MKKVHERKDKIKVDNRLAEYAALLRYYLEEVYPMENVEIGGGATRKLASLESDIILEELAEIDNLIPKKDFGEYEKNREENLQSLKKGKAEFAKSIGDRNKFALQS